MATNTTRISSKGQVVIPAWIRKKLKLTAGEKLRVEIGREDERTLILRAFSRSEIERLLEKGYEWIERTGEDLVEALHAERRKERLREQDNRRP